MKRFSPTRLATLFLALGCSTPALADCTWDNGIAGELVHNLRLSHWLPRDAPVGTVIGSIDEYVSIRNEANLKLNCFNDGTKYLTTQVPNTAPVFPGPLPDIGGENLDGRVLETDIPGVGIHIRLADPYTGGASNYWKPVRWTSVPYEGFSDTRSGSGFIEMTNLRVRTTLIKIGPIPPGSHSFNGRQLLSGTYSDVGMVMRAHLHGTVSQAQCTLRPDAVSADPVDLGKHELSAFSGEHSTTPAIPFHITLNDCEDDPTGSTATAYIHFDGVRGSTPIQPDVGLFSLNTDATATGLGIQLLHADDSPVRLQEDLAMHPLTLGDTRMHFKARYYQTQPRVTAGSAEGTLSFTISYR